MFEPVRTSKGGTVLLDLRGKAKEMLRIVSSNILLRNLFKVVVCPRMGGAPYISYLARKSYILHCCPRTRSVLIMVSFLQFSFSGYDPHVQLLFKSRDIFGAGRQTRYGKAVFGCEVKQTLPGDV